MYFLPLSIDARIEKLIVCPLYELGEKTYDFSRGMNRRALFNRRNQKV